jgi:Tol biopolymer transport system component
LEPSNDINNGVLMINAPRKIVILATSLAGLFCLVGAISSRTLVPSQESGGVLLFFSDRGGDLDIYSVLPDGSDLMRLTKNAGMNSGATLSPDGERIVFSSDRSGNMEIWVMDSEGSNPIQLTRSHGRCSGATWSPSGDRIAFHSGWDGGGIFEMTIEESEARRISPRGLPGSSPAWSPDGSRIAFTVDRNQHSEIWVMEADGSNPVQLTDTPEGGNQHPEWSPDGRWIVFNSWRNGDEASSDIWLISADGREERRVTSNEGMEEYPSWSPDGERILFTLGNAALFTIAVDGSDRKRVTDAHFFTAGADWGPSKSIRSEF